MNPEANENDRNDNATPQPSRQDGATFTFGGVDTHLPKRRKRSKRTNSVSSPKAIADRERIAKAIKLRKKGLNWREIAVQCQYSNPASAYNAVTREMKRLRSDDIESLRELELQRLDDLQSGVYDTAITGNLEHAGFVLEVMKTRSMYVPLRVVQKTETVNENRNVNVNLTPGDLAKQLAELEERTAEVRARRIALAAADTGQPAREIEPEDETDAIDVEALDVDDTDDTDETDDQRKHGHGFNGNGNGRHRP